MTKKFLMSAILSLLAFFLSVNIIDAKRTLPFVTQAINKSAATRAAILTRGVTVTVKFKSGKAGIIASFSNINAFKSISYSLSYIGNGIPQGIAGTILPGDNTAVRDLIFGTCSNGICRYDRNITNARFVITTTLKNGTKISKAFILKF